MQISELKDSFLLRLIIWQKIRVQVVRGSYEHMYVCVRFLRVTLDFPSSKMIPHMPQPLTFCWTEQKKQLCSFVIAFSLFPISYLHCSIIQQAMIWWYMMSHIHIKSVYAHGILDLILHLGSLFCILKRISKDIFICFFVVFCVLFKKARLFQTHALPRELQ